MSKHIHIYVGGKVKDASYKTFAEHNPALGYRAGIEKDGKKIWVSKQLFKTEAEAKAEAARQLSQSGVKDMAKDAEPAAYSKEAYFAWSKTKNLDPQSRVTFKAYAREKGLSPANESLLERSANIGTSGAKDEMIPGSQDALKSIRGAISEVAKVRAGVGSSAQDSKLKVVENLLKQAEQAFPR